jgi:hypothetical protein
VVLVLLVVVPLLVVPRGAVLSVPSLLAREGGREREKSLLCVALLLLLVVKRSG